MLLNPTKTQFSTNFLMVERLFKLKLTIEQIVANMIGQILSTHYMVAIIKNHLPR
jgi:glycerol uptake facilitator-like aquaporin